MSKTKIEFTYKDKDYKLEYTPETLKKLEKGGFSFGKVEDHLITAIEDLFYGAFLANHKDISRKLKEEIYQAFAESSEDDDTLADALFTMVGETMDEMKPKGKTMWKVSKE